MLPFPQPYLITQSKAVGWKLRISCGTHILVLSKLCIMTYSYIAIITPIFWLHSSQKQITHIMTCCPTYWQKDRMTVTGIILCMGRDNDGTMMTPHEA